MNHGYDNYNQSNKSIQGFSQFYKLVNDAAKDTINTKEIKKAAVYIFREYLRDFRGFHLVIPKRVYLKWLYSDEPLAPKMLPAHFSEWLKSKVGSSPTSTEAKFLMHFSENERFRFAFIQAFWDLIFTEYHPYPANKPRRKNISLKQYIGIDLYDETLDPSSLGPFELFLNEDIPDEELFILPGNAEEEKVSEVPDAIEDIPEPSVVAVLLDIDVEPVDNLTEKKGKKRTMYEIQKESIERGLAMILGRGKFVSTDLDSTVMKIITEYTQQVGYLELPLTEEEYITVSIKDKGLYPNFVPEPLLEFLYRSDYYLAKEAVDLMRSKPNDELVRLFNYYFWKMAMGHSKQHSERVTPYTRIAVVQKALSNNFIAREEYRTIIGRQTGSQNDRPENTAVKKTDRRKYISHHMTNEMIGYALDNNPLAKHYFHEIIDLFLGDFTLYLSKNLYLHISRGQLPDPDYIVPKQIIEIMIKLKVIENPSDLHAYRTPNITKAFGFMYIFWQVVRSIPLESGAIVVYERKDTAAANMTKGLGLQYTDQKNVPSEYMHKEILGRSQGGHFEVPSRIREEQLNLSLQDVFALTMFKGEIKNESETEEM
jgi:hypothetical protein